MILLQLPTGAPLITAHDFAHGIDTPDGADRKWSGIIHIAQRQANKDARIYVVAAQCYGLKFTSALPAVPTNVFILGLSWGKTIVLYNDDLLRARCKELDAHIVFIWNIEQAFLR